MNNTNIRTYAPAELEALEARLAFRMTARLTERAADLPVDVSERLRFAREQALERARAARKTQVAESTAVVGGIGASASLGRGSVSKTTVGVDIENYPNSFASLAVTLRTLVRYVTAGRVLSSANTL